MAHCLRIICKSSILKEKKLLIINPDFLQFDTINISRLDVADLRYGIKAINGYRFVIGRIYCIDIKSLSGVIIKIRFKSLYTIKRKILGEKYLLILRVLFDNFINDISQNFINMFNDKIDFELSGMTFTQRGIYFNKNDEAIFWNDVGTKNYSRYYAVFSVKNPNKYKAFYYVADWNTSVLYAVTQYILLSKNRI